LNPLDGRRLRAGPAAQYRRAGRGASGRQCVAQSDDSGWAALAEVGSYLGKIRPDFDPRLFGYRKLSDLFRQNPKLFAVEERGTGKAVYVRVVR
jgi:hypothetical protein